MNEIKNEVSILGHKFDRRTMLTGTGKLALVTAAGIAASGTVQAGSSKVGQQVTTVLYPNSEETTFNFEYYRDHHLKLIMDLYDGVIDRFELRKGLPGPDGTPPQYVAVISIYVADPEGFAAANEKYGPQLVEDVPNFTNVQPYFQPDEIFASVSG